MRRNQLCFENSPQLQQGSMLVISLFVIIIMALLGLTMVRLLTASADSVIHEVYGARALQAAQSSLELSIKKAFPLTQDGASVCGTEFKTFGNIPGLQNCTTTTICAAPIEITVDGKSEPTTYYNFASTGTCFGGKVTASRTVAVDAILE